MLKKLADKLKEPGLLRRVLSGDQFAFAEIYDLYAGRLYRHALFRTGSTEDAEEIVSETFMRFWDRVRAGEKEVRYLQAFLYRIAGNLIVDHYRRRAHEALPMTEGLEATLASGERLEEDTDAALSGADLRRALDRLRPEARDLLTMRYIDELSIAEIAELLDKKANAVYVALHRAIKELQKICLGSSREN